MTNLIEIPLSKLVPSKNNPRKSTNRSTIEDLSQSIAADGILQNLIVVKSKRKKDTFNIVGGNRRYAACKLLVKKGTFTKDQLIPVQVIAHSSKSDLHRIATIENIQREDMSILDEADAITGLVQKNMPLEDISAQTGISVSTIRKRIALSSLADVSRKALSDGVITLSQAEALTVGTHEQQAAMIEEMECCRYRTYTAEDIKEDLISEKPTVSMAMFDTSVYTGQLTQDLFGEDESTYFNDVEEFTALQEQATEELATQYRTEGYWPVEIVRGFRCSMVSYREAEQDEKGAIVIHLHPSGRVQVFDRIVRLELDKSIESKVDDTPEISQKPKSTYSKPLCENMAMHKSAAVQAELLNNPRIAKEVGIVQIMRYLKPHGCYRYFTDEYERPVAFNGLFEEMLEFLGILDMEICSEQMVERLLPQHRCSNVADLYTLLKHLSDDELDRLHILLCTMTFGQEKEGLDTNAESFFNKVAIDLNVEMADYWTPDEEFLSRRNSDQLHSIVQQTETGHVFGYTKQAKKSDLVKKMTKFFAKLFATESPEDKALAAYRWVPEAMKFPAIDPDNVLSDEAQTNDEDISKAA